MADQKQVSPEQLDALYEVKLEIARFLSPLVNGLSPELLTTVVETQRRGDHDYAVALPRLNSLRSQCKEWAGMPKGRPDQLAESFAAKFADFDSKYVVNVTNFKIHMYFFVGPAVIPLVVNRVLSLGDKYGHCEIGEGKTVVVEYSSPNIAKIFHVGHFRSTVIGNFLKHLHRALGYKVVGINYLGDWGKQYGLLALGYKRYGNEEQLKNNAIHHLFEVYVKVSQAAKEDPAIDQEAREYFTRMENGDEEALALWKSFRDFSIERYKETYERLNVHFDVYSGESQFQEGMLAVMKDLEDRKLVIDVEELERRKAEDEAKNPKKGRKDVEDAPKVPVDPNAPKSLARFVDLREFDLNAVPVAKSDGSTLYITRDIAAAISRYNEYKFDRMLYVVGSPQAHHFKQLFKILEVMGYDWAAKCEHIPFGIVQSESGSTFSTRAGNVKFLNDILDEAQSKSLELMQKDEHKFSMIKDVKTTSDVVGISGVLLQDLGAKHMKDYKFSWDRMLQEHGNTGPYLQYQHVRLASIQRKCGFEANPDADLSLLTEPCAKTLAVRIGEFPSKLLAAAEKLEAVILVEYLFDLTRTISSAYEQLSVKLDHTKDLKLSEARLALFLAAKQTLKNGLEIIGCVPLERM
eukprot:CAMPEP_0174232134 /NCGR_PEP_ID=MMETSP0417-20130205/2505_1 /TAXON_ID=242541 /ORGANISM="Mayorella sp, Strain BSH-02190019" /LENGTH=633 /DNA_ID=CAMNT_0015310133 /DNA_START=41 /DNA_END=1942 /DNA_ORIENTATION=-